MTDTSPAPLNPAAVVDEYLRLLMIPDPHAARRFVGPDCASASPAAARCATQPNARLSTRRATDG